MEGEGREEKTKEEVKGDGIRGKTNDKRSGRKREEMKGRKREKEERKSKAGGYLQVVNVYQKK